jgi:hypothetical protein
MLAAEGKEEKQATGQVLKQNLDLLPTYFGWVAFTDPPLARELAQMGRTKGKKFVFDLRPFIEEMGGWKNVIGPDELKSLIEEFGAKQLVADLTPQQRQELLEQLLRETSAQGS